MIKIKPITGNSQAYILTFDATRILILGKPDYSSLKYFRPSSSAQSLIIQRGDRKYLNSPYRLDLAPLKNIDIQSLNLILISDFKSLFLMPYIFRQSQIPILLTQPMFQLGKLFSENLLSYINNSNRFCESQFLEQSEAFDIMQQKYDIRLQDYIQLYSAVELNSVYLFCKKLNPGQHYQFRQFIITPYNSGGSIVECLWSISSKLTQNNVVIILNGSMEIWRNSKAIEVQRLKHNTTHLIIGKQVINTTGMDMNTQLSLFVSKIQKKLRANQSVHIHFQNNSEIIDIIDLLNYHLNGIFKQIFVLDPCFLSYLKLMNSFVEYLSTRRANLIHNDPPQYPFSNLDLLIDRGLLSAGTLTEISRKQKVPVKEVMLRYNPGIFLYGQELFLVGACGEESDLQKLDFKMNLQNFKEWVNVISPKSVFSYQQNIGFEVMGDLEAELKSQKSNIFFYSDKINILKHYHLVKGQIIFQEQRKYRLVPKDWASRISSSLSCRKIGSNWTLTTVTSSQSKLSLQDFTFHLSSYDLQQAQLIYEILNSL